MAQSTRYEAIDPQQVRTGMQIRVHQRIKEMGSKGMKERIQVFEGLVLTVRGKDSNKTMTIRKVSNGVGVEKIFPLNLPTIEKIELVKQFKTRRKNIGFLRDVKKRLKETKTKLIPIKEYAVPEEGKKEELDEAEVLPEETQGEKEKQNGDDIETHGDAPKRGADEPAEEPKERQPAEKPEDEKQPA